MRAFVLLLLVIPLAAADSGVLIPGGRNAPDARILSLEEMALDILIDNGTARVSVRQVFANHTSVVQEGVYSFALPVRSVLSDFAVWDDLVRIPGVILERKRAAEIYDSLRSVTIDPGILQMGERGAAESARSSEFTARVTPIPAYGTKRVEIEYHERIPIEQFESLLAIPLRPETYPAQFAGRFDVNVTLLSERSVTAFEGAARSYPLTVAERSPNRIRASFSGLRIALAEDFTVKYKVDPTTADSLRVVTHRNPAATPPTGFFQVSSLFGLGTTAASNPASRTVIAVFDTSLSMQWSKLDSSFQAFEALLRSLRPQDRFNVVVFNSEVSLFAPSVQPATADPIERALTFVKQSRLRGGSDMTEALGRALGQASGNAYVVLFTDGGSTVGAIQNSRVSAFFNTQWNRIPAGQRPRMFVFAVGDDANLPLLKQVGSANGVFEWVRSSEPVDFKIQQFIAKIGRFPIGPSRLSLSAGKPDMVYPLEPSVFGGSEQTWVGRYQEPNNAVAFTVTGLRDGKPLTIKHEAPLPAESLDHPALPRTWAKARVDALLEKIDRDGEDKASIDEIIRLSRKYKFVTPYTSFLAAPRSLLRPRVIRPGDPILRVKADSSIRSVVAVFPFGLIKPLKYLEDEDVWQTRFLAPVDMPDGMHQVQLVLRDVRGNAYREQKTFVISSKPPVVRARLDRVSYHPGQTVRLEVSASQMTRTIVARMYGVPPVRLTWNSEARSNTGEFRIPEDLPVGQYRLIITAEDIAHNIGTQEVSLAVVR